AGKRLFLGRRFGLRRALRALGSFAFLGLQFGQAAARAAVDLRSDVVGAQKRQQLAGRDGEIELRIGAAAIGAEAVDADDAAAGVEQRTPAAAARDGCGVK